MLYPTELRAQKLATTNAKKSYRKPCQAVSDSKNTDLACFLALFFLTPGEKYCRKSALKSQAGIDTEKKYVFLQLGY
jgi:hypothetical protein